MSISMRVERNTLMLRAKLTEIDESDIQSCIDTVSEADESFGIVLDFSVSRSITKSAMKRLVEFAKQLKSSNRRFFVLVHRELSRLIESNGGSDIMVVNVGGVDSVPPPVSSPDSNKGVLNAVIESFVQTVEVLAKVRPKNAKPYMRSRGTSPVGDVIGIVGITSKSLKGTFILGFPRETYLELVSRIHKKKYTELDPQIHDWAAETLNVVLGQAKTTLNNENYEVRYSIPEMITPQFLDEIHAENSSAIVVPFSSEVGNFFVELVTAIDDRFYVSEPPSSWA